ncbi:glycosyltransferase family 39 protein [Methanoregula sp.]|uniref:glycosyltransferase family 39 protein n=1 Tax=Methanoregula sp. TaxID=2052170 RepID=UPI003C707A05
MTIRARAAEVISFVLPRHRVIDLINREFILKYKAEVFLAGILLLSAFLNLWNLWNSGFSNTFYAAAVKSTLINPAAGLINSFDPAGFVTVDKPPVGLWVQAAFAAVLGFKGWVLILPQALAGIGSVALVYFIVARPFGKPAGLVAALALAVTPILVAVSRNGTMDSQLIFVLLLAVWAVLRAAREQSLPWLLASVALVGIGFNIKMIQAFVVVPAIIVIYLMGTIDFSWKKRTLHLGIAILVLLAVSLSWAAAVDMVPASERPYIGGSGDNTVLGLIVNYNGLERLGLENRGMAFMGSGSGEQRTGTVRDMPATGGRTAGVGLNRDISAVQETAQGGMANGEGTPGITRLFGPQLAGQFSWLLPLALIGLLIWVRRPASLTPGGIKDTGITSERGLTLCAMVLWLVPGLLFFSFVSTFAHTYYIATIAPPLAALVGIGAVGMYREYLENGWRGWILIGAVLVTGLLQVLFLSYNALWSGPLLSIILMGILGCTGILAFLKLRVDTGSQNLRKSIVFISVALLFVAPFVWACTPFLYGNNQATAGPPQTARIGGGATYDMARGGNFLQDGAGRERLLGQENAGTLYGRGAFAQSGISAASTSQLEGYLLANTTNETWILAVPSSQSASNLIIQTGKPVMAIGGFSGSDRILTIPSFTTLIREGKVRFFLTSGTGGGGTTGGNSGIFTWVSTHCTLVNLSLGNVSGVNPAGPGMNISGGLYDCAGKAG